MLYDHETIQLFRKAKTFNLDYNPTSISYNYLGENICATLPEYLLIYNTLAPALVSKIDIATTQAEYFTKNTFLASNKNIVFHISTHDLAILRKFKHESQVKSFSVSDNDLFLTTSDRVLVYDIKSPSPVIQVSMKGAIGTFLENNRFVVANNSSLRFYDVRNVKGPLKILNLCDIENVRFHQQSGTLIAVDSARSTHVFLDHYGNTKHKLSNDQAFSGDLSPDGQFYFTCGNGFVKIHDILNKSTVTNFMDPDIKAGVVRFNPRFCQLATANNNLCFWLSGIN